MLWEIVSSLLHITLNQCMNGFYFARLNDLEWDCMSWSTRAACNIHSYHGVAGKLLTCKKNEERFRHICGSKVGMKISRCMVYHTHTFKLLQRRLNKRFCFHFSMHNGCVPATQLNRKIFKHTHIRVHCHSVMIEAKECIVSTLLQQSTIKDSQTFSIVYVLLPSKQATHIDSNLGFRLDFVSWLWRKS